jgi:hypothetical protein
VKNKQYIKWGLGGIGIFVAGALLTWQFGARLSNKVDTTTDLALLALIKNDGVAFTKFIRDGGNVHVQLPAVDGKVYTVAEGLSFFERPGFVNFLQEQKIKFIKRDPSKELDILSLSIPKNNPELFGLLLKEAPDLKGTYGTNQWTLMHIASSICAYKLVPLLHEKGGLSWDHIAKDGTTPLTLAAQNNCLGAMGYWKSNDADFNAKDGRGISALSILKKKKNAELIAFAESFEERLRIVAAVAPKEVNFYKKRKIPKDQIIDPSAIVEPIERPVEAVETAEFSEFAD